MSDIFEELVGSGVDPQALAAALRKQSNLGQVGQLTGIPQLQALGRQLSTGASAQASDYADRGQRAGEQAARNEDRGLQRALMQQNARQASLDRRFVATQASGDRRFLATQALDDRRAADEAKAAEKRDAIETKRVQAAQSASGLITQLRSSFNSLKENGGITDVDEGNIANTQAYVKSSGVGQLAGRVLGTKAQSERNSILQTRPLLLAAVKDATNMSARQLDSNAEKDLWLTAMSDPKLDYQANIKALENIENFIKAQSVGEPPLPSAPPPSEPSKETVVDW